MQSKLEKAQWNMAVERAKLANVMDDPEVWAKDSKYITEDIIKAAEIAGVPAETLAGLTEVLRLVKAVRGTTGEVRRLTLKLRNQK